MHLIETCRAFRERQFRFCIEITLFYRINSEIVRYTVDGLHE